MPRTTRIPRTRPSVHRSVIVCDNPCFASFFDGGKSTIAVSYIEEEHNLSDESEDEMTIAAPQKKGRNARKKKEQEEEVEATDEENVNPNAQKEDSLVRKLNEYKEFFDDIAEESLYLVDENGDRLMMADNGKKAVKFDENVHKEREQKRQEKFKLTNELRELRGEKKNKWFGYAGPLSPVNRENSELKAAEALKPKKSEAPVVVKKVAAPPPESLEEIRKKNSRTRSSVFILRDSIRALAVSRLSVHPNWTAHDVSSKPRRSVTFGPASIVHQRDDDVFASSSNDVESSGALTSSFDASSLTIGLAADIAATSGRKSFILPSSSRRTTTASIASAGFCKSTPIRTSQLNTDPPVFPFSPIARTSAVIGHSMLQGNFLTSTPCAPRPAAEEKVPLARSIDSNSTIKSAAPVDDDLCDISALSLDENPEEKESLSSAENFSAAKDKQSPGSKRSSSESWNRTLDAQEITPSDKKRRTDDSEENVLQETQEPSAKSILSTGLCSTAIEDEKIEEEGETVQPAIEASGLSEFFQQEQVTVEAEPAAAALTIDSTAFGVSFDGNQTEQQTLAVDATGLGQTLAADATAFGNTTNFTNTMLADATAMTRTRNATQIVSFYEGEDSQVVARIPFFLKDYEDKNDELEKLLFVINQPRLFAWKDIALKNPRKLGEGVYGEVFATTYNGKPSAVKIIPFAHEGHEFDGMVNGETLWNPEALMPEVLITRTLAQLHCPGADYSTPNFIGLLGAHVAEGSYPATLLKAWDQYDKKKGSENDRPSTFSAKNRLHLVICLAMGGVDLESFTVENENQALSILLQTGLSLMVAEERLQFEHRDLHIGNILVQENKENIEYRYNGTDLVLASHGVKINIIDFTLSRMYKDGTALYRDLGSDEELFQGQGNYQFDIYRMMREHNRDNWSSFWPKTNCFWLHYLAHELILNRKCTKPIPAARKKKLMTYFDRLLEFDTVSDLFADDEFCKFIEPFFPKA